MMKTRLGFALGILALAISLGVSAQQPPNLERGFAADKIYALSNIDNVNVFNGNLLLALPIGQRFPLSANLSYGLSLTYNSKLWDFVQRKHFDLKCGGIDEGCHLEFQYFEYEAVANRRSNAGLGWLFNLGGRLHGLDDNVGGVQTSSGWVYEAPDGSEHAFYGQFHNSGFGGNFQPAYYTNDNSFLRLRLTPTNALATHAEIDFPDGSTNEFEPDAAGNWRLTRRRDQYKDASGNYLNWMTVTYAGSSSACATSDRQTNARTTSVWVINDSQQRRHDVCLSSVFYEDHNVDVPNAVVLSGFQGQRSSAQSATYTFGYTREDIDRSCFQSFFWPNERPSAQVNVPTLTTITLPDNAKFDVSYNRSYSVTGVALPACETGTVHSIKLPTGGKYVYDYQVWDASSTKACPTDPNIPGNDYSWSNKTTGVRTKHEFDAALNEVATWQYLPSASLSPGNFNCTTEKGDFIENDAAPNAELAVTVITPVGNKNVHYFSIWPGINNQQSDWNGFHVSEYGLPLTRNPAHVSADGLPLSTEAYEKDGSGNFVLKRQTFATYGADTFLPDPASITDRNRHITLERTVFHDDGDKYVQTTFAGEDGFGHQRTATTAGTFGSDTARSTFTNYNPGSDQNGRNGSSSLYFPPSSPWILNTFTDSSVTQGPVTAQSMSCFDGATGFLFGRKSINSAFSPPQTHRADVVVLYQNDGMGNAAREDWFGGDKQDVSTMTALCSPTSMTSANRIDHTYSKGVLAGTTYKDPSTRSTILRVIDHTIDSTGLVWKSRDHAGIETVFNYDSSGRVTSATTPGTANVGYEYHNPGEGGYSVPTAIATVTSSVPGNNLTHKIEYDAFGRVKKETRSVPAGTTSRVIVYDAAGQAKAVTEWEASPSADASTNATRYTYDAFGRPLSITAPDHAADHPSIHTFAYLGTRQVTKRELIGASSTPADTAESYDVHGRLGSVLDANGTATSYTYDVGNRLATVSMGGQPRSFSYDNVGLLRNETHPENGTTTYGDYDARGHATTRVNGSNALTFAYDPAERLHTVTDQSGKTLKQFEFGTASNGNGDGKLISAMRRNNLTSAGRIDVTENYEYAGAAGLMSKRTTSVERVSADGLTRTPVQQFAYGLSYNDLLLPQTITMPTCSQSGCSAQTTQQGLGSVSFGRRAGYLTAVNGFASLTYQPSGMVESVVHTTPQLATDKYAARFGQARPTKITFAGCGNTAPVFLPGNTIVKPLTTGNACGIQVTWPTAVICGGSSNVVYRVLRDGVDVTGPNCLTSPKFIDQNNVVLGTTYAYTIVAEGPAVPGLQNAGRCQLGQTTQLTAVSGTIRSCNPTPTLIVSPAIASVGVPATFRATLSSDNGPVAGEELIFSLNGEEIGRPRTGTDGLAILTHVVDLEPKTYADAVVVTYAGGVLAPKTVSAKLTALCSAESYTITPIALNLLPVIGPSFNVFVNTSSHCQWTPIANAKSGDNPFLQVSPASARTGKGIFTISVSANDQPTARSSHVQVEQQFVSVDQGGIGSGCTYRFPSEIAYVPAGSAFADAIMPVTATDACHWTASTDPSTPWIHFNDPTASSGTGNGQIRLSVEPNLGTQKREAIILLSDGTTTVAKGFVNQLAPPPAVCPVTLVEDLRGGSVEKGQNIPLRVYTTGTELHYQWFINDQPVAGLQAPSMTVGYFNQYYPAPGHSTSFQVRVYNSCGEAFSSRVTWDNNATSGQCTVPVVQDSLERPNETPPDSLSPFPGAHVFLSVSATHADFSVNPPLTYTWYQGLPGDRSSRIPTNPDDGFQDHITVSPFATSFYWVEITDACGSQQSRSAAVFTTIPPTRRRPSSKDFTGDGKSDLAWHNTATGQNEVWQMNGTTHAGTIALPANQDLNAQLQSTGDMNADGNTDVVWRDPLTGHNEVWLMNRTQLSEVKPIESRNDPHWTIGAVADYDNDNNDDIVWHNSATGENEIWFNSGTDHAGTWALPASPDPQWGLYGTGDFNGDEKPDLFFHNRSTGENQIWTMDDATRANILSTAVGLQGLHRLKVHTQSLPGIADTNWMPVLVADMDGDGRPDIVWRNKATGENQIWIMSPSLQVAQTVAIEPRTDLNWQIGGGGSSTDTSSGNGGGPTSHGATALHVAVNPAAAGDPAVVIATLTAGGVPVAQHQLIFTLSGTEVTRPLTDAAGNATAIIETGARPAGTYPQAVSVRFDGDNTYDPSSQSADLVITSEEASVTWKNPDTIVYGTPLSATQLNATASVPGTFVYIPAAGAVLNAGFQTIKATFTPNNSSIAPITRSAVILVNKAPSSVSWTAQDTIAYGTPLSDLQLNATSSLPGTFTYDPGAGTTLSVGNGHPLKVTFAPDSPNFDLSTATTTIDVGKGIQLILWDDPAPITVLQPLGAAQLDASIITSGSAPPGPMTYDPPLGTILTPGIHALRVTVGQTDSYEAASASADLIVARVTPNVRWAQPTPYVYGTTLSNTQLNATADVPGTFIYMPPGGTILDAGTQQLSVLFMPSDSRYDTVSTSVTIQVLRAQQVIAWRTPAPITYGTRLSATQLNAQVTVVGPSPAGHLAYTTPFTALLPAGLAQTLTVIAAATQNYDSASASVSIDVLKATPVVTWPTPAPIVYGTPLSATQLNATANVAGSFSYTPTGGTVLNAGANQALQVVFTPSDVQDYTTASQSTTLTVTKAYQTIIWPNPSAIVYGTLLSSAQLNATVSVVGPASAGVLTYTPATGTLLQAGPSQSLSVAVAETQNYNAATATALLTVQKARPVLTWANPSGIIYGTALSNTQLNAGADVSGTFAYTPPTSTILNAGPAQTLTVAFTPTNARDYENASTTAKLDVAKATQTLSWSAPGSIVYGTRLSAIQLNATVSVVGPAAAGALVYAPPASAPLDSGAGQTLTVTAQETTNYLPATRSVLIDVNRAPLSLTVAAKSKLYGAAVPLLTGTLTGVVNGDNMTPSYATTATQQSVVGTYPITATLVDAANRSVNYSVTITPSTLTVGPAPLQIAVNAATKQYSDPLPPFSATFTGLVLGETPAVLTGTLTYMTSVTLTTAPGMYPLAVSGVSSPNYAIVLATGTLTVTAEDARAYYTGAMSAMPLTSKATTAAVTLSATIKDISATPEANGDTNKGDIRNATATFVDRGNGATLCTAPIGLVNAADLTVGTLTCTSTVTVSAASTLQLRVGIVVGKYYVRNAASDDTVVTIAKLATASAQGNGKLALTKPAGAFGADGWDATFSLNASTSSSGDDQGDSGNPKFKLDLKKHVDDDNHGHQYRISATSLKNLVVNNTTHTGTLDVAAVIEDWTGDSKVVLDNDAVVHATFTAKSDNNDNQGNNNNNSAGSIAITIWNKKGGLWFASNFDGTKAVEQNFTDGDLKIR